jgi:acyl-CoA thioesterase-1
MTQINLLATVFFRNAADISRRIANAPYHVVKQHVFRQSLAALVIMCSVATGVITGAVTNSANADTGNNAGDPVRLMVLGDSLVAGHGLPQGEAFPDILGAALTKAGHNVVMLNAGVSGDTTAGGLARLDWSLADNPDAMIVVLGGNDLLRGLEPASTRQNIADILNRMHDENIPVLLAGMQAPRNLGADYAAEFDRIYTELGADQRVIFYPFFLEGVALEDRFNQPDGLHPNLDGVTKITAQILPYAEQLVAAAQSQ